MCAQFRGGSRGGAGDEEDRSITNEEPIIPSVDEHGLKETTLKDSYRITLVPSSDGISVCGKLFNREYWLILPTSFCVIEKFCSENRSEELTSIWKTILFFNDTC
ncbi:hypothetical protein FOB22_006001 [Saccharomyces cerevisiae]|nr:hypothetical protein FOB22_006001 [Saccharomyces cerevisiae]